MSSEDSSSSDQGVRKRARTGNDTTSNLSKASKMTYADGKTIAGIIMNELHLKRGKTTSVTRLIVGAKNVHKDTLENEDIAEGGVGDEDGDGDIAEGGVGVGDGDEGGDGDGVGDEDGDEAAAAAQPNPNEALGEETYMFLVYDTQRFFNLQHWYTSPAVAHEDYVGVRTYSEIRNEIATSRYALASSIMVLGNIDHVQIGFRALNRKCDLIETNDGENEWLKKRSVRIASKIIFLSKECILNVLRRGVQFGDDIGSIFARDYKKPLLVVSDHEEAHCSLKVTTGRTVWAQIMIGKGKHCPYRESICFCMFAYLVQEPGSNDGWILTHPTEVYSLHLMGELCVSLGGVLYPLFQKRTLGLMREFFFIISNQYNFSTHAQQNIFDMLESLISEYTLDTDRSRQNGYQTFKKSLRTLVHYVEPNPNNDHRPSLQNILECIQTQITKATGLEIID